MSYLLDGFEIFFQCGLDHAWSSCYINIVPFLRIINQKHVSIKIAQTDTDTPTHTHSYSHTQTHTYTHTHTHTHTHTPKHRHTHTHTQTHPYTHTHSHSHTQSFPLSTLINSEIRGTRFASKHIQRSYHS